MEISLERAKEIITKAFRMKYRNITEVDGVKNVYTATNESGDNFIIKLVVQPSGSNEHVIQSAGLIT